MIRVTIELVSAVTGTTSEIGRMYITNDGTGTVDLGSYDVAVCRRGTTAIPAPCAPKGPKPARAGRVENYRRQAYNIWRLVTRACLSAFPEERAHARGASPADGDDRQELLAHIDALIVALETEGV